MTNSSQLPYRDLEIHSVKYSWLVLPLGKSDVNKYVFILHLLIVAHFLFKICDCYIIFMPFSIL